MKKILFTWELGIGLGHLLPIKHICEHLNPKEFSVYIAIRDLQHAHTFFNSLMEKGLNVSFIQAPYFDGVVSKPLADQESFAGLMYSNGFETQDSLMSLTNAWQFIFDAVKPDVIVYDHSPTALFASLQLTCKKLVMGSGFLCPPFETDQPSPLFGYFYECFDHNPSQKAKEIEHWVLDNCNAILSKKGHAKIQHIGEIYSQADETLLTTFNEFDHFPSRKNGNYIGLRQSAGGQKPNWPQTGGKKVFIYVKAFKQLLPLLELLAKSDLSIIFYTGGLKLNQQITKWPANIYASPIPFDMKQIAQDCDFAILNGNHDTCIQLNQNGVPCINIPIQKEQSIFSKQANQTGANVNANAPDLEEMVNAINYLIENNIIKEKAQQLANALKSKSQSSPEHIKVDTQQIIANKITTLAQQ